MINELLFKFFGVAFDETLSTTSLIYTQRTFVFDSSKARRDFGYTARVSVTDGIRYLREAYLAGTHSVLGKDPIKYK